MTWPSGPTRRAASSTSMPPPHPTSSTRDPGGSTAWASGLPTPGAQATAPRGDPKHPFYSAQLRIVRETSGKIDPERIGEYIAHGGYHALHKALTEMTPS